MVRKRNEKKLSCCGYIMLIIIIILFSWICFVFYKISNHLENNSNSISNPSSSSSSSSSSLNNNNNNNNNNFMLSFENEIKKDLNYIQILLQEKEQEEEEKGEEEEQPEQQIEQPEKTQEQIQQQEQQEIISELENKILSQKQSDSRINTSPPIHIVFSTDCGGFQDWQTLVFFYSARIVKQPGHITRIASGCSDEKQTQLTELYQKLFPEFSVHFTPDYSKDERTGQKYHFYNKPYGVLHWIEHSIPPIESDTIVAICDPDFIFLRPLTPKLTNQPNTIVSLWNEKDINVDYIQKGHPVAQQYGLGAPWVNDNHLKFNRTFICGKNSPCTRVPNAHEGGKAYSVGPPYILELSDLHRLTKTWCQFVPRVFVKYPYLLAEMYGYSMAAAHEELPHLTLDHFMVSDIDAYGEGWKWIDNLGDNVCQLPDSDGIYYPQNPLPTFIHYCQAYRINEIGYGKRRIPLDIFTCSSPMLLEPNPEISHANSFIKDNKEIQNLGPRQVKRNAFVICTASRVINSALEYYKSVMCDSTKETINYEKTLNIFK